jgi:GLPGLI family protein
LTGYQVLVGIVALAASDLTGPQPDRSGTCQVDLQTQNSLFMKQLILVFLLLGTFFAHAQDQGKITYEEYIEFEIELPPEMAAYADMMPTEQRTMMDLFFNANESMYKASPIVETAEENPFEENGMEVNIRINTGGEDAHTYFNQEEAIMLRAENVMGKKFLVTGERNNPGWKIAGNQKEILGYQCLEATLEMDSTTITAWFTPEIPVAVGPGEFNGLPGAILGLVVPMEDTELMITATEISLGDYNAEIIRPTKGKKVTSEEFDAIMEERMQEMERMYGGEGHETESGDGTTRVRIIRN